MYSSPLLLALVFAASSLAAITVAGIKPSCTMDDCSNYIASQVSQQSGWCNAFATATHNTYPEDVASACFTNNKQAIASKASSACMCLGHFYTPKPVVSSSSTAVSTTAKPTSTTTKKTISLSAKPSSTKTHSCATATVGPNNCPASNGTLAADGAGNRYQILCDVDINTGYHETPAVAAAGSLQECMDKCATYLADTSYFACKAVSFSYGSLCYFYDEATYPTWGAGGDSTATFVDC